uniref:Uncharacterized protein n=1 Tax=Trichogramma kaykai TaxID=54128 RepID=A0ABD2W479_9HYME
MPVSNVLTCSITTTTEKPITPRYYRYPPKIKEVMQKEIDKLIKVGSCEIAAEAPDSKQVYIQLLQQLTYQPVEDSSPAKDSESQSQSCGNASSSTSGLPQSQRSNSLLGPNSKTKQPKLNTVLDRQIMFQTKGIIHGPLVNSVGIISHARYQIAELGWWGVRNDLCIVCKDDGMRMGENGGEGVSVDEKEEWAEYTPLWDARCGAVDSDKRAMGRVSLAEEGDEVFDRGIMEASLHVSGKVAVVIKVLMIVVNGVDNVDEASDSTGEEIPSIPTDLDEMVIMSLVMWEAVIG